MVDTESKILFVYANWLNLLLVLIILSLQVKHAILQIELYNEQIVEIDALYKSILD